MCFSGFPFSDPPLGDGGVCVPCAFGSCNAAEQMLSTPRFGGFEGDIPMPFLSGGVPFFAPPAGQQRARGLDGSATASFSTKICRCLAQPLVNHLVFMYGFYYQFSNLRFE